jgi:hypothetical protein
VSGRFRGLAVGQHVDVKVLAQQSELTYVVSLAGEQHLMESSITLVPGAQVSAVVLAVGNQLELRYVGSDPVRERADDTPVDEPRAPSLLQLLAGRYKVVLTAKDRGLLERAVRRAPDPASMALGGLYLVKLGAEMDVPSLAALYAAQTALPASLGTAAAIARPVAARIRIELDDDPVGGLSELLAGALHAPTDEASSMSHLGEGADAQSGGTDGQRHSAHSLLNSHDGGAVAYRYGSLPVLVSGQLMELELVLFQQRQPQAGETHLRRLVMTLDTETLGPLQIEARALNDRLMIRFTGQSAEAAAQLAPYGRDVEELAARLGWTVDGVEYEYTHGPARAASQIIRHVLAAGTVDSLL